MKDIVLAQSKKELVSEKGDWIVDGTITQYSVAPIAIQAGSETAAQSRLTMTVKIGAVLKVDKVENNILVQQDSLVIDPTASEGIITAFVDFDNSANFASIEDELLQELVRQLSQDIYDKVFGGKW